MNNEAHNRTRVYARRRLIELGELLRYDWIEKVYCSTGEKYTEDIPGEAWAGDWIWALTDVKRKYATKKQIERDLQNKKEGHYHSVGEKVIVELKEVFKVGFETMYGYSYAVTYISADNRVYHYVGGSVPDISDTEFTKVKGTVKHDNYKGIAQTKLQRIKII